jgi:hypothetical protein
MGAAIAFDALGTVDFAALLRTSKAVGAPLRWAVEDFDRAFAEFGIIPIEGHSPARMMERAIELYWSDVGPLSKWMVKRAAKVPALARRRSGTIYGRLSRSRFG